MKRNYLILFSILFLFTACKKDDDSSSNPPASVGFVEKFSINFNGTVYNASNPSVTHSTNPDYIDIIGESGSAMIEFEAANDLSTGSFSINSQSTNVGFAIAIGSNAYYCTSCQGNIETHDETADFFKVTLSGTMTKFLTNETRQLQSAEIAVFY